MLKNDMVANAIACSVLINALQKMESWNWRACFLGNLLNSKLQGKTGSLLKGIYV